MLPALILYAMFSHEFSSLFVLPPTSSSLPLTDRSFRYASPCLWNQPPSSPPQPHFGLSVSVLPLHICSYHIFSLCQLTALTIRNSLSLSLPPQDLPLSQIFRLPSSLMTDFTDFTTGPFLLSIFFVFSFFIILFCLVPCGRLSWLLVSFWAHVNIVNRIVSCKLSGRHSEKSKISHILATVWPIATKFGTLMQFVMMQFTFLTAKISTF